MTPTESLLLAIDLVECAVAVVAVTAWWRARARLARFKRPRGSDGRFIIKERGQL